MAVSISSTVLIVSKNIMYERSGKGGLRGESGNGESSVESRRSRARWGYRESAGNRGWECMRRSADIQIKAKIHNPNELATLAGER